MSRRRRNKKKLVVGLVAFALLVTVAWILALPLVVRSRVTALTGCPVDAETISVNPFAGTMRLAEFRLRNPAGFPAPEFVDLKLFDVDVAVLSLLGDEIVVPRAVIDLEKVTIVTNADGVSNTDTVRQHIDAVRGPADRASGPTPKFRIGELIIRIGIIEIIDYSRGGAEPVRRIIPLKADHRFQDVTDAKVVVRPLLADLARANAGNLLGTLGGLLPGPFREVLGGATGILGEEGRRAGDAMKKLIDSIVPGR